MIDTIYVCLFLMGFGGIIGYYLNKDNQKKDELGNIIKEYSIIQDNQKKDELGNIIKEYSIIQDKSRIPV